MTQVLFILLLAASVAFFARTIWLFGRAVADRHAGSAAAPRRARPVGSLDVGIYFFGQKKVAEEGPQHRTSKHHLFIFWGFLIITIATADIVVSGVIPGVSLALLPGPALQAALPADRRDEPRSCSLMIVWAIIRRTLVKPRLIPWNLDAGLILGAIGALMVTHFFFHALRDRARSAAAQARWYMPISNAGRQGARAAVGRGARIAAR